MGELIRSLADNDRPLCPNTTGGRANASHILRNRTLDAFYGAADKDANGEMAPDLDKAYGAAAYGVISDRMYLYHERVGFLRGKHHVSVESWWFQCPVCGLILQAQRVPDGR